MKLKVAFLSLLTTLVAAGNNYPVVLIHGLGAFAQSWAYIPEIENAGITVLALNVGKFTSVHNRACEIYAQLKGTVVDYGVCHSAQFGHARFGRDYTGQALYPQWDANHPVHIWGHSLGAPTITTLERLLRQGSGCAQDTSPLFTGGKRWLASLTTLSGVLSGTTLVDWLTENDLLDLLTDLIVAMAGLIDNTFINDIYNIDFSQWGIERLPGESFSSYWSRVESSGILSSANHDISTYDLSTAGARARNALGPLEYSDTYYFSFATERTHPDRDCIFFFWCTGVEEDPDSGMNLLLQPTADIIGENGAEMYRKNDGLVNWVNQLCPVVHDSDRNRCTAFSGSWPKGQWVYKDVPYLDHIQITSRDSWNDFWNYGESAKKIYVDHAARIKALPPF